MKDISRQEFTELKAAASHLSYYWFSFRHSSSPGKVNFEHSFFIRDFLNNNGYLKILAFDTDPNALTIQLTAQDYDYLKKCHDLSLYLQRLLTPL